MNKTRWISLIVTCFIIILLLFAGNANALTLTLTGFASPIGKGSGVTTSASITIHSGEIVINPIEIHISGVENRSCLFQTNATAISGCQDISITLLNDTTSIGYGYAPGFGFGNGSTNGNLNYTISINTSNLSVGTYSVWISTNGFDSPKQNLTINPAGNPVGVPSVNANSNAGGASVSVNAFKGQEKKIEEFTPIAESPETKNTESNKKAETTTEKQKDKKSRSVTGNVVNVLGPKGTLASGLLIALVIAGFITSSILTYIKTGRFRKVKKIFKGVSDYSY